MTSSPIRTALIALLCLAGLVIMFDHAFLRMITKEWQEPDYQYAYLIPFMSFYLIWIKAQDLQKVRVEPSWAGVGLMAIGLAVFLVGELSSIYFIVWYAFLITFWGLAIAVMGWRAARTIWAGLFFLVFMIPLPAMWLFALSGTFQLWSSEIGTAILRLMGVAVYLEGNVIDLGSYKLQVVEACSGLRYLFPLASFAFFCACIFKGPLWQRVVLFVSSVPITIFMNSFRIAVTGVLVNKYGTSQAEGFLHFFEGWVIFVACLVLLFLEMGLFARLNRRELSEVFDVEVPTLQDLRYLVPDGSRVAPVNAAVALILTGAATSLAVAAREELVPQHVSLKTFPTVVGRWSGRDGALEGSVVGFLKLTDYVLTSYVAPDEPVPVELYVAYYESQRTGASIHSPRACLPGGGWQIQDLKQVDLPGVHPDGSALPVNRVLIGQGENRALVYYWFVQRGRYLTDEYQLKAYIVRDAVMMNRTDGALVRVMTPVMNDADLDTADARLLEFVKAAQPKLHYHLPQGIGPAPAGPAVAQAP